jgi:hypothetical protein
MRPPNLDTPRNPTLHPPYLCSRIESTLYIDQETFRCHFEAVMDQDTNVSFTTLAMPMARSQPIDPQAVSFLTLIGEIRNTIYDIFSMAHQNGASRDKKMEVVQFMERAFACGPSRRATAAELLQDPIWDNLIRKES